MADTKGKPERDGAVRRYRNRGVDVEVHEGTGWVELELDGTAVEVEVIDDQYFSHLANMFTGFPSVDDLVDTLLANEGRTWTLRGHLCDERCGQHGHHHGGGRAHHSGHDDHGGHQDHAGHQDHGGPGGGR